MNLSPDDLPRRLRDHWRRQRGAYNRPPRIRSGVSTLEVAEFETRHQVFLPFDFRRYVLEVDGMEDDDVDDEMISFWRLRRIDEEKVPGSGVPGELFVFVDGFLQAETWAIQLSNDRTKENAVFLDHGVGRWEEEVAPSFSAFIEKYLADPKSIWL